MKWIFFDASGLVKRYTPEAGAFLVDQLFARVPHDRMMCLMLGAAEVAAALVRKRNRGQLPASLYGVATARLRSEVLDAPEFFKLPAENPVVEAALPFLDHHSINATDAVVLRLALDVASRLRGDGDELILVAADQRLVRAARAEGLLAFDLETQAQTDLDALLGP